MNWGEIQGEIEDLLFPRLDLDVYPFLPRATVATTSAASYMSLLSEAVQ